jgi:DNA/RNA endonuclease YhcR with UshA esterase domain
VSVIAWIAFIVCAAAVLIHYMEVRDSRFLLFAIPGLMALLAIPMTLSWLSRRTFSQAEAEYSGKTRAYKIGKIGLGTVGQAVSVRGTVQKVSFKWLNRPHFQVRDDTGIIKVIMFTAPAEDIKAGDDVYAVGVVIKNIFDRRNPAISAVSIKKQNT